MGEGGVHRWWGAGLFGLMILSLNHYGEVTVVGREGVKRLWDLSSRWWPKKSQFLPGALMACRSRRKARKGATPVPGPTMMIPVAASGGIAKPCAVWTSRLSGAPGAMRSAKKVEATPRRRRLLIAYRTASTVSATRPAAALGEEAIE